MINVNGREITMAEILALPKPIKMVGVAFLSLLIRGIGYGCVVKKNRDRYHLLRAEVLLLKQNFEKKQHEASTLDAYRQQMVIIDNRLAEMLQQWPSQNEMPGILDEISKTGIASGLTVELFAPKAAVSRGFYSELPIEMTLVGQYHQLVGFLSRVAQMSRLVTCHEVVIERQSHEKKPDEPGDLLRIQLIAKIYRYHTT